jgi:uncharacterized protein YaaQ
MTIHTNLNETYKSITSSITGSENITYGSALTNTNTTLIKGTSDTTVDGNTTHVLKEHLNTINGVLQETFTNNQHTTIYNNVTETYNGNKTVTINTNETETITGELNTDIIGDYTLHCHTGPLILNIK